MEGDEDVRSLTRVEFNNEIVVVGENDVFDDGSNLDDLDVGGLKDQAESSDGFKGDRAMSGKVSQPQWFFHGLTR